MKSIKRKPKFKIVIFIFLAIIAAVLAASLIYVSNYYHADEKAMQILEDGSGSVEIVNEKNDTISFIPQNPSAGLIFYPGGKVQYEAYSPLMEELAEKGILCVLVHMPGNLAVLDKDAAEDVLKMYPEIENWYIAGHSLGGVMASSYLGKNFEKYDGLILLAAYSTEDLTDSGLSVLSIYGSEDRVVNKESYEKAFSNLPEDTKEFIIEGGCHSQFGCYGAQKGDGEPEISPEEQIDVTVSEVAAFIHETMGLE